MIEMNLSKDVIEMLKRQPPEIRRAIVQALHHYKVRPRKVEFSNETVRVWYNTKLRLYVEIPLSEEQYLF